MTSGEDRLTARWVAFGERWAGRGRGLGLGLGLRLRMDGALLCSALPCPAQSETNEETGSLFWSWVEDKNAG